MTARVAAVVLGWNGREDTLACLRSLQRATYPELSIVVVDNGSTDGGPEAVAAEFPDVRLLQLGENRGFAGGVNAGADAALGDGAEAVLLLNNDATVEPGFLEPLVDAACAEGVGRPARRSSTAPPVASGTRARATTPGAATRAGTPDTATRRSRRRPRRTRPTGPAAARC